MSWVKWRGKELIDRMESAAATAVMDTANAVGAESDQQVPHDEGTLQQSKTIMANPADKTKVNIGYGGGGQSGFPVIPYAVKWHEVPANFQKGRKHNYLRDPINNVAPRELKKNLKKAIQ